jgi:hypothetical protein
MPRDWTPRESRLVAEWAIATYPAAIIRFRVSLGSLTSALTGSDLTADELRAIGHSRRWVDAMIVEPNAVHLVEAKIRLSPGALEQLELYRRLFPMTPELQHLHHLTPDLHLVFAVEDPVLTAIARERGVHVHTYHPAWVDEYLNELLARERRPTQPRGLQSSLPLDGKSETK